VLSREEFLSDRGRWWNEIFENLDFDGNNAISRSEWLDSDASFDRLDRDHNGIITKQEFYNPR
jgi:Ca2+-binding EF-hand superfamily protein